tara:strand:- start:51 stop:767 length:717 start_codon:yes stop_codon:yes gene_type:complete
MDGLKNKLPALDPEPIEVVEEPKPLPKTEEVFDTKSQSKDIQKVEKVEQVEEPIPEPEPEPPKKQKKKRECSDKLRAHLAAARAKSLATRKKNAELKKQKLAEAETQIKQEKQKKTQPPPQPTPEPTQPPPKPTSNSLEIDYDRIIYGVSKRLVEDYDLNPPPPIQKPEPPQPIHKPILKTEAQIRQEERNAAKTYYEQQAASRQRKDIAMNVMTRTGMPKLNRQPYSDDVWDKCFRR